MKTPIHHIVHLLLLAVLFPVVVVSQTTKTANERYEVKNVSINNKQSNFGTSYYGNHQVIYASPAKRSYLFNNIWQPNQQPYLDFYTANISSTGDLVNSKRLKTNSYYHEGIISYDASRGKVYFTRNNYGKGKHGDINRLQLFVADVLGNDTWTNIKKLPFNDSRYSYGHPALSEDGKTLYFVSDMPGGLGRTDIYKVSIKADGRYGTPKNLGKEVNTAGREMFPYVDGTDLYFSTDSREDVYGGLDVYMIRFAKDKTYPAINLGKGINSVQDDFAFIIDKKSRTGYFSSNRLGGKGDDDIYYFKELRPFKFKCTQYYTFTIKDKKTKSLLKDAYITITDAKGADLVKYKKTNNGVYKQELNCDSKYTVIGNSQYHKEEEKTVYVDTQNEQKVTEPLFLEARFVKKRGKILVDIKNIYFDYNKANIRPDAAIELYKVVEVMKSYPTLKIEAGSHTDSRGKKPYNQLLSYKRAKSVVDFIISKGISPLRITSKGYGESQPINGCVDGVKCLEGEHSLNRRTEFVILNPEELDRK